MSSRLTDYVQGAFFRSRTLSLTLFLSLSTCQVVCPSSRRDLPNNLPNHLNLWANHLSLSFISCLSHLTGVRQPYEIQVFDDFAIKGNTGILRCHVPSFVREYVKVTNWIGPDNQVIQSNLLKGMSSSGIE